MMTDPIADMLTRIRNAIMRAKEIVDIPLSREKEAVAGALKREGYIKEFKRVEVEPAGILRVYLKYGPEGESVIHEIRRASKPSRRVYRRKRDVKLVLRGLGTAVISTSKGVLSDREAKKEGVGGEVLLTVW